MSAAIALMFLAEAATTCPPGDNRLRAGASVVQAIVSVEPKVYNPPVPRLAASNEATDSSERGSAEDGEEPQADQLADQCKAQTPIA